MAAQALRHEALFYAGEDSFLAAALPFIRNGVGAREPVLVALSPEKIELLRSRLDGAAGAVTFADMHDLGRNPALIIPAWEEFIARNATGGRRVRGLGEPIWPERSQPEMVECGHHESLLNLAFADGPEAWFLCAYDTHTLRPGVLRAAAESHPLIDDHGTQRESSLYVEPEEAGAPFDGPLPDPPAQADELPFDSPDDLGTARRFVADRAAGEVIDPERADGLVLAVDELVTNSLRHGGGSGVLRAWHEDEARRLRGGRRGNHLRSPGRPASPVSRQAGRARPLDRQPFLRPPPDPLVEGRHEGSLPARADHGPVRRLGSPTDRARRGGSGALSPAIRSSGAECPSEGRGLRGQYAADGVDGQVPRNARPRTRSGPEGSSLKR